MKNRSSTKRDRREAATATLRAHAQASLHHFEITQPSATAGGYGGIYCARQVIAIMAPDDNYLRLGEEGKQKDGFELTTGRARGVGNLFTII